MKRIFSTILISLLFQIVYGQLSFTTFYTKDGKETKNQEQAHYYRELSVLENSQIRVIEKYIQSNQTKLVGTFPSIKDKKFIGQKFEAFENGKIKSKEFYSADGVMIDTAYYYHPNGRLKIAFEYPYKVEKEATKVTDTLILVYHDSLGSRLLQNGNGYAEIDFKNSSVEKGNYKNHKRIGKWTGTFMDDKYSFEETYDNGKLISGITKDSLNKEYIYDNKNYHQPPSYPGDIIAIRRFIANNYRYPQEAIRNRVKGTVKLSFVIDKEGNMVEMKVEEDLGFGTGEEGIRILKRAKKWTPGYMRGIPVRVSYSLPIRLDLSGS
ncbi:energy transducer TonB [Sphingobacterium bovistauri]|uniref:Energy transducer TonB n=1 Tax=Sphingobacterium bovistauri TaxID=2781959 RepID=A0ABS7Z1V8_9SPHI|nr:energy transducer TonB [Sphingobacterium bovistauri]MCA5004170.1 energy transducer TonB [Sphingobacterium bovistauri]